MLSEPEKCRNGQNTAFLSGYRATCDGWATSGGRGKGEAQRPRAAGASATPSGQTSRAAATRWQKHGQTYHGYHYIPDFRKMQEQFCRQRSRDRSSASAKSAAALETPPKYGSKKRLLFRRRTGYSRARDSLTSASASATRSPSACPSAAPGRRTRYASSKNLLSVVLTWIICF